MSEESQQPQNTNPLLTIAVPTYNRAMYLKEFLSSIFDQLVAEPRVELIISDNASTDQTSEIVEDYSGRGLQIRYLRNESNTGMDANILQCFQQARGTYVWVFGDDDLILAGSMEKIL